MARNTKKGDVAAGKNKSIAVASLPNQANYPASQNGNRAPRSRTRGELKEKLHTDPTRDYHSSRFTYYGEIFVQNLPLWRLWTARMMLTSDPVINFSLNIRNAALMAGDVIVTAKRPEVKKWVEEQWTYLWNYHRPKLVSPKKWGYASLQPLYGPDNQGLTKITGLKDFAPEDVRALEQGSRVVGSTVKGTPLYAPQSLWLSFSPEFGGPYGVAVTRRQYPAWYEKWMERGAKRLQQQRMIKDAYIGDVFWYPPNLLIELPGGTKIPWKDVMREIGENRYSGGVLTLPKFFDNQGHELTSYQPPTQVPGATEIFNWVETCDENILRGADVPFEVVQAADTGSGFSGRSIPFLVLLGVCDQEFKETVQQVDERVLRPVAWLNFGGDPEYTITPVNLVKSFRDDISGSSLGGGAIGGQQSQAPQQGQQPGQGVPQAVTQQYDEAKLQPGLRTEKVHDYSCLLFNLPGDLAFEVRQLGDMIPSHDLGEDGKELNPHVTIKFGLHTDDPEVVRQAIQSEAPVAIQIGPASFFSGEGHDVLKLDIQSEALHRLNATVNDRLAYTDTHPEYKPHITVAYVKPGLGAYYAKRLNALEGKTAVFDRAIFSDKHRCWFPIRLLGTAQFTEGEQRRPFSFDEETDKETEGAKEPEYLRRLRKLIGMGKEAAARRVEATAKKIRGLVPKEGEEAPGGLPTLAGRIEEEIRRLAPLLGTDLVADSLPNALYGSLELFHRAVGIPSPSEIKPSSVSPMTSSGLFPFLTVERSKLPLLEPALTASSEVAALLAGPDATVPVVHLPTLDASVKALEEAPPAVGATYKETANLVRQGCFAITGDLTEKAVGDVKEQLAKVIQEGKSQKEFIEVVATRLETEGSPLSPAHLENVFRTNTMSAYGEARYKMVTTNPMVTDAFPYVLRSATRDARVRPQHFALETAGLDGTAIYRVDDPTWQKFRAPWDYNCRCRDTYLSVDLAAEKGVKEAQEWIARAKEMAKATGGSFYQFLEQTKPASSQHVTPPDFEPSPEFKRADQVAA